MNRKRCAKCWGGPCIHAKKPGCTEKKKNKGCPGDPSFFGCCVPPCSGSNLRSLQCASAEGLLSRVTFQSVISPVDLYKAAKATVQLAPTQRGECRQSPCLLRNFAPSPCPNLPSASISINLQITRPPPQANHLLVSSILFLPSTKKSNPLSSHQPPLLHPLTTRRSVIVP